MPMNLAMWVMSATEFLLWAALGYLFWTKKLQKRFPAMSTYLGIRVLSMPVLLGILYVQSQPWGRNYFPVYFFSFWTVYIASAITLFLICADESPVHRKLGVLETSAPR